MFTLIFAFGVAAIPVAYALSYYFKTSNHGFVFLVLLYLLFGMIFNLIFAYLYFISMKTSDSRMKVFIKIGLPIVRLVPIFSFLFGFDKVYILNLANSNFCPYFNETCPIFKAVNDSVYSENKLLLSCCPGLCRDFCINNQNPFSVANELGAGVELIYLFAVGIIVFGGILIHDCTYDCK